MRETILCYPFLWLYSGDMVWIPCSGTVLRGQEVLLGHEQLDDNITKVTRQLMQRQSQDEGSRAPRMRRICPGDNM